MLEDLNRLVAVAARVAAVQGERKLLPHDRCVLHLAREPPTEIDHRVERLDRAIRKHQVDRDPAFGRATQGDRSRALSFVGLDP
jgi:hypothetical protein